VGKEQLSGTAWPEIAVTADILVFSRGDGAPEGAALADFFDVLLIRRRFPPFEGRWALPGGGVELSEGLEAAARRELFEETGLSPADLVQFRTYGEPGRDPRCRVVSVVYYTIVDKKSAQIKAGDDAGEARWFPLSALPELAFDHETVISDAKRHLFGLSVAG
jgi:8-oxo-dGTP diphosphatase